tara:strand:- start:3987 stop:5261 length:1275 start_codon:yes stop_codon:yes gene_type:complete
MLVWYRPQPDEVNFLPWLEDYLIARRRQRQCLYGSALVMVMLGVSLLVLLHVNLLQVKAGVHKQIAQGTRHLLVQQQRLWAESLHQRRLEWGRRIQAQQLFDAWWPVHELSQLLTILEPYQQLVSWQWQPINTGQQVVFMVTGRDQWQDWWQRAVKVWPSLQVEALDPEGDEWTFEAHYQITDGPLSLPSNDPFSAPTAHGFSIQLTPQPLADVTGVSAELEPLALMMRQVAAYGQGVEIVRGQGVQMKMRLEKAHWAGLAPLPSAKGWRLQNLSVQQTPSQQWLVSMQWLPNNDNSPSHLLRKAPTTALQTTTYRRIEHYARAFKDPPLLVKTWPTHRPLVNINPARGKLQLTEKFEFIGYSQQQGQAPLAWIKLLSSGQLLRTEVGHQIDSWRVSAIGAQGVRLTLGQQSVTLKHPCFKGAC